MHDSSTPIVRTALQGLTAGTVLDVGCGNGRNSLYLARRGWRVVALDNDPDVLAELELVAKREGLAIEPIVADVLDTTKVTRAKRFEAVICTMCLHFLPDQRAVKLAAELLQRATAPGGVNIVSGFTTANEPGVRPYLFRDDELRQYYKGWKISRYELAKSSPVAMAGQPVTLYGVCRLVAQRPLAN